VHEHRREGPVAVEKSGIFAGQEFTEGRVQDREDPADVKPFVVAAPVVVERQSGDGNRVQFS
jgi:hypothetical protein